MDEAQTSKRWCDEIQFAQKDAKYVKWLERAEAIVSRYRDERNTKNANRRRFNILWSNVETLRPAIYSRMPKPIVERRFMDRDPAARLASQILERCLTVQMEAGYFHESTELAVLDHLLPGMGQTWERYEPEYEPQEEGDENAAIDQSETMAQDVEAEGDGEPYEKIAYERVCTDYVYWKDFLWGPARVWREVPWVARCSWCTTSEIAEKFYKGDMAKARQITLDYTPDKTQDKVTKDVTESYSRKAAIWEIWNKADQTVYFIPTGTPGVVLKTEKQPVLKLEGFWPCPEPLFATQSNNTLVPVPDYVEYQDQAMELDDLTNRISALTTALRANGVYNSEFPELARLLTEGQDNKLIPVSQWAMFAEKGGMPGAISLVPIKDIGQVLIGLYEARSQVKNDLYEITGMSDIIRGQGAAGETATAQRIKGQFASMRLEERRQRVAEFARSIIRIKAEIICEVFAPETLLQMSGMDQQMADLMRKAAEGVPQPQPSQPPQPQPGMDPRMAQVQQMQMQAQQAAAMQQYQAAQAQAAQQAQQKFMAEFQQAVQILKSDKLRGFRVDIETDSTIQADAEAQKQSAVELMTAVLQALTAAGPVIQMAPELMAPIGETFKYVYRTFRVGRSVEASWEEAIDRMSDKVEAAKGQPPPPSPEQIKAEAELKKQAAENDRMQADAAIKQQQAQQQAALQQQKAQQDAQARAQEMEQSRQQHEMTMAELAAQALARQQDTQAKNEDRQFQRQSEQEKMGFAREQHAQTMQSAKAQRDGKRAEQGLPPEDHSQMLMEHAKATTDATAQGLAAMAEAVKSMGENIGKGMSQMAEAIDRPRSVTTPDGRQFTSRAHK